MSEAARGAAADYDRVKELRKFVEIVESLAANQKIKEAVEA
jgi:hypothetical protein